MRAARGSTPRNRLDLPCAILVLMWRVPLTCVATVLPPTPDSNVLHLHCPWKPRTWRLQLLCVGNQGFLFSSSTVRHIRLGLRPPTVALPFFGSCIAQSAAIKRGSIPRRSFSYCMMPARPRPRPHHARHHGGSTFTFQNLHYKVCEYILFLAKRSQIRSLQGR
jgi:hypothetical protein